MNIKGLLIALVRNAIKGEALDFSAVRESLSAQQLATLFKVSKKHDVAHLVSYSLEKNGFSLDCDAWQSFLKEREQATLRYEMMQADLNEISACLENNQIDYIPLKGAVVRRYYPEPWMRTSCDIDVLVRETDFDKAVNALVKDCMYTTDGKRAYHDISLYSPFGMHLELHHSIMENEPKFDALLSRVWSFSSEAVAGGHKYLQSNEFLMLHLVAHAAYHFSCGGCGLRSVLDIWLLKNSLVLDNSQLKALLEEACLSRFYNAISDLGEYWFGKGNAEGLEEIEKYILLGGAYGSGKQASSTRLAKKGGRFRYFWSRIFLPYESLAILYPVIKHHKILTPFCQIARWFGAIFKGNKVKREIKNVVGTNKEQAEKTRKLLDSLGL